MAEQFIFSTTGTVSPVKFHELGKYFEHPTSAYTLSNEFTMVEIQNAYSIQSAITNGEIVATDENGNVISNLTYLTGTIPVFEIENVSSTKSYIGYGTESACKILEVSSTGSTYTSLWANGNESFDKAWSARTLYSYF